MPASNRPTDVPSTAEVRAELARIAGSEVFRGSPQLAAFLTFVVEATLAGDSGRIKGYTIAVEALGRSADFDPQTDAIVRVEATRLRRALERYYASEGAANRAIITLTRGSYVPTFSYRGLVEKPPAGLPASLADLPPGNGMPVLLVEPFDLIGHDGKPLNAATALQDKLCDAFARFDTVNVVSGATTAADRALTPAYRLLGSIEYRDDGTIHVGFRLLDSSNDAVVWSQVFDRLRRQDSRAAAEDAIITELCAVLVQPYGVIRSHERTRHISTGQGDPRYRAFLEASDALRSFDHEQHIRARDSLEHLIRIDPSFAIGYAMLAALYGRQHLYGPHDQDDDFEANDRALELIRRAIEMRPESALAYQILFAILFFRQDVEAAFAAGDKALARNPYDITLQTDYAGRLIMIGEVARGMEMLARTAEFGVVRPSWYHFYFFLGSYLTQDLTGMMHHAHQITGAPNYPLGFVARTLAAAAAGEYERAQNALDALWRLNPQWRSIPRSELGRFFPSAAVADRLARDLGRVAALGGRPPTVTAIR
jgi:tetratricopeptide (TPR) repeat protein